MDIMKAFAKLLKKEIDSKRVTVTDVARAAGCSRQHIYDILAGETDITLRLAEKIAETCGIKISVQKSSKISA